MLLLLVSLSLPIIKPLYILEVEAKVTPSIQTSVATSIRFGVWGMCLGAYKFGYVYLISCHCFCRLTYILARTARLGTMQGNVRHQSWATLWTTPSCNLRTCIAPLLPSLLPNRKIPFSGQKDLAKIALKALMGVLILHPIGEFYAGRIKLF